MPESVHDMPPDMPMQQAFSVSVPDMHKCSSTDEFSIMILQALEAICLHKGCKDDKEISTESEESADKRDRRGKIWLQIYADTCQVDSHTSSVQTIDGTGDEVNAVSMHSTHDALVE